MEIIDNSIGVWKNIVPSAICRELIAIFDEKERKGLDACEVDIPPDSYEHGGIMWRNDQKRIDVSAEISRYQSMHASIDHIERTLIETSTEYFRHFQTLCVEEDGGRLPREGWTPKEQTMVYKMQKTHPNGGFCKYHFEQGHDDSTRGRYAVWMLYLNDVTEGGCTDFPAQKISLQPTEGTLVIWPAAYTHPHRSAPDLRQTKYIITGWFEHMGGYETDEHGKRKPTQSPSP